MENHEMIRVADGDQNCGRMHRGVPKISVTSRCADELEESHLLEPQNGPQPETRINSFPSESCVPPGLEVLSSLEAAMVKQAVTGGVFSSIFHKNKYDIFDKDGEKIFTAVEQTGSLSKCCFRASRPFSIEVYDKVGTHAFCLEATLDFFGQTVAVQVPPGQLFALIDKEFALLTPSFYIRNQKDQLVFKISTSIAAAFGSTQAVDFDVRSADDGLIVGKISKHWGGLYAEWFTDADTFGIQFHKDMAESWKAVLLAALFHIDFTFYDG